MVQVSKKPLSELKQVSKRELERSLTEMEISQMETEMQLTDAEIAIMELQDKIGG